MIQARNRHRSKIPGVLLIAAAFAVVMTCRAHAVTHLLRGDEAPRIALPDRSGTEIDTSKLQGRIVIVIFGELYHEKTRETCAQVDAALEDARLSGERILPILVVTQEIKREDLRPEAKAKLPTLILRDTDRGVFGVYRVAVMPSAVVIDKQGKVVHAVAGLTSRFADVLTDSLLYAAGKLSAERLELSLHPEATTLPSEGQVRAERIAQLARQLSRRGLDEMAAEKYAEALKLHPSLPLAHLELGMLLLKHRRLAEAESEFRTVLAGEPKSSQAKLGLAYVQAMRGGAELPDAEAAVREVLASYPSEARAHYLMGLINEQGGKLSDAAASFKKAAELLLERSGQE